MPLKLMYITNRTEIAHIAEQNGVDRIFVDMEYIGKAERQGNMDSVQNHHTIEDIVTIRSAINKAELLVRVNPIHNETESYSSSEDEIDETIAAGADIIMLPYYKTLTEVDRFLSAVNGRCRTMLLLETPEAVNLLDETLEKPGIDEIHIGLNDLSIGYKKKFLFELLSDGTVERLCRKMEIKGMFYGFGGIASLGRGLVPAEMIIKEHYRLGSRMAILSRSFCNVDKIEEEAAVEEIFFRGVREIRTLEDECQEYMEYFTDNMKKLKEVVDEIKNDLGNRYEHTDHRSLDRISEI